MPLLPSDAVAGMESGAKPTGAQSYRFFTELGVSLARAGGMCQDQRIALQTAALPRRFDGQPAPFLSRFRTVFDVKGVSCLWEGRGKPVTALLVFSRAKGSVQEALHPPWRNIMKLALALGTALALPLVIALPSQAENPAQVQQLLTTNLCAGCDLSGADLTQAHLIGADLSGANLSGANLTEANLEGADLSGANLEGANLSQAFLTNALLNNAVLDDANLTEARIYFAEVAGSSWLNANLTGTEIVGTPISIGGD
ncbi:low-complexity protein [Leptolyngbya sp. BL0902]|nr:low-complexity protein [Leptolyngbya sp. BL0902]